ncbi:MAG: sigma-70 family RNA polymerase sigma factor [Saccharothrix sp.]|nr:sigma-70 family RNA polymerase sigma factor [Saccharothrix sp.]
MTNQNDGSRAGFEEFYRRELPFLLHLARKRMPSPENEDVVHEVFTRMWQRWDEIEGPPFMYAQRVLSNLIIERRRKSLIPIPVEDHHSALVAPVTDVEARARLLDLLNGIEQLSPRLQEVAVAVMLGYSNREIAKSMGCTTASVATYRWLVRRRLEALLIADVKGRARGVRNDDRGDT